MTTTPAGTVTMQVPDLLAVLLAAVEFTCKSDGWTELRTVQLAAGGGVLTGTATDRYIAGHARRPATGAFDGVVAIDRDDVKRITDLLHGMGEQAMGAEVTIIAAGTEPRTAAATFTTSNASLRVSTITVSDSLLTSIANLFTAKPQPHEVLAPFAINPRLFRAFTEVQTLIARDAPCRVTVGSATSPIRLDMDDWFVGLMMPTRIEGPASVGPVPFGLPMTTVVTS